MSFELGRARSMCICHGSMISGRPVAEPAPNFGAA